MHSLLIKAVKQCLQCVKNMVPHLGCLVWYWEKIVFQHICRPSVAGLHTGTEQEHLTSFEL